MLEEAVEYVKFLHLQIKVIIQCSLSLDSSKLTLTSFN
jgi:hypothetical protein